MTEVQRIGVGPHLSHIATHNGIVHLSGVVSPGKSVREQTRNVLAGIDELLQSAGSDKSKILSATVWLTDMRHFDEMNRVWDRWVSPGNAPARACIEAKLSLLDFSVAIAVTAAQ
jgi:enamine deaminase RidA (YjgF/YER057c/UK114 family)